MQTKVLDGGPLSTATMRTYDDDGCPPPHEVPHGITYDAPPSFRAALVIRNELSRVEREPVLIPLTILSIGRRSAGTRRRGARARVEKGAKEGGVEGGFAARPSYSRRLRSHLTTRK